MMKLPNAAREMGKQLAYVSSFTQSVDGLGKKESLDDEITQYGEKNG